MSEISAMDEGRRQAYLAALAIPLWSSRLALPGALPANPLERASFVDAGLTDTAGFIPALPESSPAMVVKTPEAQIAHSTPAQNITTTVAVPVAPARTDEKYPRFSCRVQVLAPGWLGVIALNDAPDLSAQEYRLLGNLVQALGGDMVEEGARDYFHWPMSPNPSIPRDAGAAREALAAFLGRRRESARWLVLGETLAVYVRAALAPQRVIAAPSLRELLVTPDAKRTLWQALHD